MIRIRHKNGSVTELPDGCFVELVNDLDKNVNTVFYQQDAHTVIQVIPGSAEAARYAALFHRQGVKFNDVMINREKT